MIPDAVQRYGGLAVPRYTSYPTAAEFSADVGPADHAQWLAALHPGDLVSIYLHVPYCREICHYCGCSTKMVIRDEVLARYGDVLIEEIARVGRHLTRPPTVSRIHWGGGTPSLLGADGLQAVIEALCQHVQLADVFEHAIELDPRSVTRVLARGLVRLGITRVSLGIQDLDPTVQVAIGRVQPLEIVEKAIATLREAGIPNLNADLIYGLPHQTGASVSTTARLVAALGFDRVACYGYAHLPARKRNQRLIDAAALPEAAERFAQAQAVSAALQGEGYQAIGIDHFAVPWDALSVAARDGRLHRNFQGYTDDASTVLLGLGASAISRFKQGFVQNVADPRAYAYVVGRGHLPVARGHRFAGGDVVRGALIERLMCDFRVDLAAFGGPAAFRDELAQLRPLVADGLATRDGSVVAMTSAGRPFVRVVAALFDAYRHTVVPSFSAAL